MVRNARRPLSVLLAVFVTWVAVAAISADAFGRLPLFNIEKLKLDGARRSAAAADSVQPSYRDQEALGDVVKSALQQASGGRRIHDLTREDEARGRHSAVVHHSLHPPFTGVGVLDDKLAFWDYGGSTVVTDRYIRLTPEYASTRGYLWNTWPNAVHSWEAFIGVAVHSPRPIGADGMAFWYRDTRAPSSDQLRSSASALSSSTATLLGATDDFVGLGLLFDSYDNDMKHDNPRVTVVYNPPSTAGSGARRGAYDPNQDFAPGRDDVEPPASCYFNFRNTRYSKPVIVKVRYDGESKELDVILRDSNTDSETHCAHLTDVILPTGYFFGFTAATGNVVDNHDIVFFHLSPHSPRSEDEAAERELEQLQEAVKQPHHDGFRRDVDALEKLQARAVDPADPDAGRRALYDRHEILVNMPPATEQIAKRDAKMQRLEELKKNRAKVTYEKAQNDKAASAASPQGVDALEVKKETPEEYQVPDRIQLDRHIEFGLAASNENANGETTKKTPVEIIPAPPPEKMRENDELTEYRRSGKMHAHHSHNEDEQREAIKKHADDEGHGHHGDSSVPANEKAFWDKRMPTDAERAAWAEQVRRDGVVAADPPSGGEALPASDGVAQQQPPATDSAPADTNNNNNDVEAGEAVEVASPDTIVAEEQQRPDEAAGSGDDGSSAGGDSAAAGLLGNDDGVAGRRRPLRPAGGMHGVRDSHQDGDVIRGQRSRRRSSPLPPRGRGRR